MTTTDGDGFSGDALVLAAGSQPNFFRTAGAEEHAFPLYSLDDAQRLRSRILGVFEDADRDPALIDQGALNFVVVGGGPTGVELAGALADLIHDDDDRRVPPPRGHRCAGPHRRPRPHPARAVLRQAHDYVAKVLGRKGVRLHLGVAVTEVGPGTSTLARRHDDPDPLRRLGRRDHGAAAGRRRGGCRRAAAGASTCCPTSPSTACRASTSSATSPTSPARTATPYPQLGSVALQSGAWAADNILADFAGKPRKPFHYHDKGIMAMIGRGAAIAEVGAHRHELHGVIAFSAWLGVHAALMTGVRNRIDAFVAWGWDYFSHSRGPQVLDRSDAARIDWGEDAAPEPVSAKS